MKDCNEKLAAAQNPRYICNPETGRWILRDGVCGQRLLAKLKSQAKSQAKSKVKSQGKKPASKKPSRAPSMSRPSLLHEEIEPPPPIMFLPESAEEFEILVHELADERKRSVAVQAYARQLEQTQENNSAVARLRQELENVRTRAQETSTILSTRARRYEDKIQDLISQGYVAHGDEEEKLKGLKEEAQAARVDYEHVQRELAELQPRMERCGVDLAHALDQLEREDTAHSGLATEVLEALERLVEVLRDQARSLKEILPELADDFSRAIPQIEGTVHHKLEIITAAYRVVHGKISDHIRQEQTAKELCLRGAQELRDRIVQGERAIQKLTDELAQKEEVIRERGAHYEEKLENGKGSERAHAELERLTHQYEIVKDEKNKVEAARASFENEKEAAIVRYNSLLTEAQTCRDELQRCRQEAAVSAQCCQELDECRANYQGCRRDHAGCRTKLDRCNQQLVSFEKKSGRIHSGDAENYRSEISSLKDAL